MSLRHQASTAVLAGLLLTMGLPAAAVASEVPTAPRAVHTTAGIGSVTVSWRKPKSAGAEKVDRYKVTLWSPGQAKRSVKVRAATRSTVISGLLVGRTYKFTVKAHNARGWSKASRTVSAVPLPAPLPPPPPPPPPLPPPQPLPGFGTIAGPCNLVAPELPSASPSLHHNALDFGADPFDEADLPLLTAGAQEIHDAPGLGGSSLLSEMFAFETLARCEGASLLKTTTEIVYDDPSGDLTDLLVQIAGAKVGVSVARAVSLPVGEPYSQQTADALVANRLAEVNASSDNVTTQDAWFKQVLVVIAFSDDHADKIEAAWAAQDPATKADTVVYVVVTHGSDLPVYGV